MTQYDAIILGGGVGGMCTAALLAREGLSVALLEKRSYLGGRFSTVNRKGYACAVGGLAVPVGHNLEQVCEEIGIPSGVVPSKKVAVWLDGKFYDLKDGGTRRIIQDVASPPEAERVIRALNQAMAQAPADDSLNFRDWLNQYTHNPRIHGLFQATISSLLTVNAHELPAGEYFRLIKVLSPLVFGYIEGGSLALWTRMAQFIEAAGGTVLTGASASKILVDGDLAAGANYRFQGAHHTIRAPYVISNLGPTATADLVGSGYFDNIYLNDLYARMTPTALIWMHFASNELFFDYSAISVGCARRVNMIDVPSLEVPGLAPDGMYLYTLGAAPSDTLEVKDPNAEFEEVMKDLERLIPDFEQRCTVLSRTCYRGKWPGFRTAPGSNMSHRTPIQNLYNVGDAACPSGYAGSMGAAKSAQLVRDDIRLSRNIGAV